MKSLVNILENSMMRGFFNNVGSYSPGQWFKKIQRVKAQNIFWGDQWMKEYSCDVKDNLLEVSHYGDYKRGKITIDMSKGRIWQELCKRYNPLDYRYRIEPISGDVVLFVYHKDGYKSNPGIIFIFHEYGGKLTPHELNIENNEMLGISDKEYLSHGYVTGGYFSGRNIQNSDREFIESFIGTYK